jgi:hypothetical protein
LVSKGIDIERKSAIRMIGLSLTGRVGLVAVFLLLGAPTIPAEGSDNDHDDGSWVIRAKPAQECPELFGDRREHDENRVSRENSLEEVECLDNFINLVHSTDWTRPRRVSFEGLELVDTSTKETDEPVAVFRLDESVDEIECEPGLYLVRVDDSIGEDARVLAILENVVLIEWENDLGFLQIEGTQAPRWRTIWRSSWKLPRMPDSSRYRKGRSSHRNYSRRKGRRRR